MKPFPELTDRIDEIASYLNATTSNNLIDALALCALLVAWIDHVDRFHEMDEVKDQLSDILKRAIAAQSEIVAQSSHVRLH